jgi:hypothetical protein
MKHMTAVQTYYVKNFRMKQIEAEWKQNTDLELRNDGNGITWAEKAKKLRRIYPRTQGSFRSKIL